MERPRCMWRRVEGTADRVAKEWEREGEEERDLGEGRKGRVKVVLPFRQPSRRQGDGHARSLVVFSLLLSLCLSPSLPISQSFSLGGE